MWEGSKGIDDAALQGLQLRVVNIEEWAGTLTGGPLEEVRRLWGSLSFDPETL